MPRHPELLHFDPYGEGVWVWPTSNGGKLVVSKVDFNLAVRKIIHENQMHADEATVAVMHPWFWLGDDYVRLKPE